MTQLQYELDALKDSNVYKWLHELIQVNATNLTMIRDDVQFRWLQGQAQMLTSLVTQIDEAAEKSMEDRDTAKRHAEMKKLRQKQF